MDIEATVLIIKRGPGRPRKYTADEMKQRMVDYQVQRYKEDPDYRAKQLEYKKKRYHEILKNDPEHKEKMLQNRRDKYKNDEEYRKKKIQDVLTRYHLSKIAEKQK